MRAPSTAMLASAYDIGQTCFSKKSREGKQQACFSMHGTRSQKDAVSAEATDYVHCKVTYCRTCNRSHTVGLATGQQQKPEPQGKGSKSNQKGQ